MTDKLLIRDEYEMMSFGGKVAKKFPKDGMVYLNGDLGAGKTTLVRGLLRSLGYEGTVKSPTYTLVEPYQIKNRMIYHFDLYRLADPEELEYIGGREYWNSDALCLVEWPEKAQGFLPDPDLIIDILYKDTSREIITNTSI